MSKILREDFSPDPGSTLPGFWKYNRGALLIALLKGRVIRLVKQLA